MLNTIATVIGRDLKLALRRRGDAAAVLVFIIVASLFPLGNWPGASTAAQTRPGILWVAALLASMLSLPRLFEDDYRDGSLGQMALSPQPFGLFVLGKILAHWLSTGLPLTLLAPILGLQFDLSADALCALVLALALGTPALSAIGAIGAALTLGVRGGGDTAVLAGIAAVYSSASFRCWRRRQRGVRPRRRPLLTAGRGQQPGLAPGGYGSLRRLPLNECTPDQLVQVRRSDQLLSAGRTNDSVVLAAITAALPALWLGLAVAPGDFQQGEGYRIIFVQSRHRGCRCSSIAS